MDLLPEVDYFTKWKCLRHVTLEPSLMLMYLSTVVTNFLFTNLFLQKSCRFNATAEPDLKTPCDDERAGQTFMTQVNSWRYSVSMYMMIVFTILGSSWSDKAGRRRRPLIFIPLVGQLLVTAIGCLYSYFWQWSVMSVVIIETIIHGVTGSRFSLLYTTQMYMCDVTTTENRTFRLGILTALHSVCIQIGSGVSGYVLKRVGFFNSFLLCTVLTALSIVLGIILMEDTSVPVKKKLAFWQMLNPTGVYESFRTVFKKRPFNRRVVMILLLIMDTCTLFAGIGESTVLYLYFRFQFGWNEEDYSLYIFCKLMITSVGTVFSVVIMSKYLKLHDGSIGAISCFLSTVAAVCYMFADNGWQLYSISVVDCLRAAPIPVISAFLSKCLEKNEIGHLMSIRCVLSLITPLCFPVYNRVYETTRDSFPSAFFIITIAAYLPAIFLFGVAYRVSIRNADITVPTVKVPILNQK